MTDEQETVRCVLASLKRASENAYSWSLTPNEAGVLVAEVERLRAIERERTALRDGAEAERAAVVAWLRTRADRAWCPTPEWVPEHQRGEHRREEKP